MPLRARLGDRAYVLAPLVGYRLAELLPDGRWRVVGVVRTEREAEEWLASPRDPSRSAA